MKENCKPSVHNGCFSLVIRTLKCQYEFWGGFYVSSHRKEGQSMRCLGKVRFRQGYVIDLFCCSLFFLVTP